MLRFLLLGPASCLRGGEPKLTESEARAHRPTSSCSPTGTRRQSSRTRAVSCRSASRAASTTGASSSPSLLSRGIFPDSSMTCRASDMMASRKMGTYYLASLLFKTYFRVRSRFLSALAPSISADSSSLLAAQLDRAVQEHHQGHQCGRPAAAHGLSSSAPRHVLVLHGRLCVPARGLCAGREGLCRGARHDPPQDEAQHRVRPSRPHFPCPPRRLAHADKNRG